MNRVVAALLTLLLATSAFALDPQRQLAQYKHSRWTVDDGAPADIRALAQTPDGWLWIGAATGLYRFDGVSFEAVPGIGSDAEDGSVTALFSDRAGALWIGYGSGRIGVLRQGRQTDLSLPETRRGAVQFAQEPGGAIWMRSVSWGTSLARHANGRWQVFGAAEGVPRNPTSLAVQADGSVWIATVNRPLHVLRPGATRFEDTAIAVQGKATLVADGAGAIWWLDPVRGAARLPGADTELGQPVEDTGRRVGLFDRDGNLWAGTRSGGLLRLPTAPARPGVDDNPQPPAEQAFQAKDGLSSNTVSALLEDAEGNLWVGTTAGLDRFRAADVVLEPRIPSHSRLGYVLQADRRGTVHVVDSEHAFRIRPGQAPEQLPGQFDNPQALCEAPDGAIWLGTHDGMFRLEGDRYQAVEGPPGKPNYLDCTADAQGDLWFARVRAGFFRRSADGWTSVQPPGLKPDEVVAAMLPDRHGGLLLSLWSRGLARLDTQGLTPVWPAASMPAGNGNVMWRGARDDLVGGQAGLARLRDGKLQTLADTRLAGLTGIVQSPEGETWLLGRAGIGRLPTAALERAFDTPGQPLPLRWFDHRDGLDGPPTFSYVKNSAARGGDGRLWFITTEGIVKLDPARLARNRRPPTVVITALVADGKHHRDPGALVLNPGLARLDIRFSALSLTVPERVKFRYRLEGVDAQWVEAGTQRHAGYTQLAPGRYRFQVIASNNDDVWNTEGATLSFEVPPTFVQSTAFRLLCAAAAGLLLWLAYRLRIRQVTAHVREAEALRTAERERIARDLHDTLLQSFQGLMLRLQAVANGLPAASAARQQLEQSLERGDAALLEGRERVQQLRAAAPQGDIASALEDAAQAAADKQVATQVTVTGSPQPVQALAADEAILIGREALANALRHAEASRIDVVVAYTPEGLRLSVCDDGIGLPAPAPPEEGARPHFGLVGMRERAARIGASLEIGPGRAGGTCVSLQIPARAAYREVAAVPGRFWRRSGR